MGIDVMNAPPSTFDEDDAVATEGTTMGPSSEAVKKRSLTSYNPSTTADDDSDVEAVVYDLVGRFNATLTILGPAVGSYVDPVRFTHR
jgi:hypothetical protein